MRVELLTWSFSLPSSIVEQGVGSKALGMGVSRFWHGSCGSCHLFVCVFLVVRLCFLSFICLCLLFFSFCVCHCFFGWAGYCLFLLFIILKDSAGLALWPKVMHHIYLFLYYYLFFSQLVFLFGVENWLNHSMLDTVIFCYLFVFTFYRTA